MRLFFMMKKRPPIPEQMTAALQMQRRGENSEAERVYRKLLQIYPALPEARHFLGLLLYRTGRIDEGIKLIRQSLTQQPGNPVFLNNLGFIERSTGSPQRARTLFVKAVQSAPTFADAWFNLGITEHLLHNLGAAVEAFSKAIELQPNNIKTHVNLACTYSEMDLAEQALWHIEQAIRLDEKCGEAYEVLSKSLLSLGRGAEAEHRLTDAAVMVPEDRRVLIALCKAQIFNHRLTEARATINRVLSLFQDADTLAECSELLRTIGQYRDATSVAELALRDTPRHAKSIYEYSASRRFCSADLDTIDKIENRLAEGGVALSDQAMIHFALGKMLDDCGEFDRAFTHFQYGNQIKHQELEFDIQKNHEYFDALIEAFTTKAVVEQQSEIWSPSTTPIFIVGMPRSGTSLVEQILASHPEVRAGGELPHVTRTTRVLCKKAQSNERFPACIRQVTPAIGAQLSQAYLDSLPELTPEERRVTDKMPANFLYLPLIAMMFPHATIIHCTRNPLDTCFSVYCQLFNWHHAYSFDLKCIAAYFNEYSRLMMHWKGILAERLIEVNYESLVLDSGNAIRRLLHDCSLPWTERCLQFHQNSSPVGTASSWQVRQPLYANSIDRWKNYEKHLMPLIDGLVSP